MDGPYPGRNIEKIYQKADLRFQAVDIVIKNVYCIS